MRRAVALAILFLMSIAAGSAQAERRVALVIGNASYTAISPLANAGRDAVLMAETLERVGFEVTLLIDADQGAMKRAMLDFGRTLRGGADASLFFYAGHGVQAHNENYLIPFDANIADEGELELQAVNVNAFLRVMEGSDSKVNIVVLDACRNNPFASSFRSAGRGLARVDAPRGTYIAYSTAPGQVAEDGTGLNSPYTAALAKAMLAPDSKLEDTFKETRRLVLAATGERQVPWETSSITGDFYFRAGAGAPAEPPPGPEVEAPPAPAASEARLAWDAVKDTNSQAVLRSFIARYPDSLYTDFAWARLEELKVLAAVTPEPPEPAPPVVQPPVVSRSGGGDWFVILGSVPHAAFSDALGRTQWLAERGIKAGVINTNDYPNLTNGFYSIVLGPYAKGVALETLAQTTGIVGDAYIKSGY